MRRRIPAWRRRQIEAQDEAYHAARDQRAADVLGLADQDPEAVYAWSRRIKPALFGVQGQTFCLACEAHAGRLPVQFDTEPDTPCAHCGKPIAEASA